MNFFLKLFPLPSYLSLPAMGVDLSDRSIKYVELEKHKTGLRLKKFGQKNIDSGIIEGGEIKQKELLIKQLKTLKRETGRDYITASLPEEKGFLKVVLLPMMEEEQIKKSLWAQLESIVPLPPKEVVFDFEIINQLPKQEDLRVALSAFPKKLVEDYAFIFKRAGFIPAAFELENQSIYRVLTKTNQQKAVMIVDFGKTRTSFLIGEEDVVKFSSTISVAGKNIDEALSRAFNTDLYEAERIKKQQAIYKKTEDEKVINIILPILSVIKDEMRRVLNYWSSHAEEQGFKNKEVDQIILCGGDSNLTGMIDYLSYELKKPVKIGNSWSNITTFKDYIPEMSQRESLMYVTALGLALRPYLS